MELGGVQGARDWGSRGEYNAWVRGSRPGEQGDEWMKE